MLSIINRFVKPAWPLAKTILLIFRTYCKGALYKLQMLAWLSLVHLAMLSIDSPVWNIFLAIPNFSCCTPLLSPLFLLVLWLA